jgi:hypothetical protein
MISNPLNGELVSRVTELGKVLVYFERRCPEVFEPVVYCFEYPGEQETEIPPRPSGEKFFLIGLDCEGERYQTVSQHELVRSFGSAQKLLDYVLVDNPELSDDIWCTWSSGVVVSSDFYIDILEKHIATWTMTIQFELGVNVPIPGLDNMVTDQGGLFDTSDYASDYASDHGLAVLQLSSDTFVRTGRAGPKPLHEY